MKTEIAEYLKLKYAAPSEACKCGNCQLVPTEVIWRTIGTIDGLTDALKAVRARLGEATLMDFAATASTACRAAEKVREDARVDVEMLRKPMTI